MSVTTEASSPHQRPLRTEQLDAATIRLAGDSGDGMQLAGTQFTNTSAVLGNDISTLPDFPAEIRAPAGTQFTNTSAVLGNDISTLPDFPAEIRAPAGTLAGVSGFQIHFSSHDIHTPGDRLNTLVAMNPAALKTNVKDLEPGGILIVNTDAFGTGDLHKAGYKANPLEDSSLKGYRLFAVPITALNRAAVADLKLTTREADRCKNFF